MTLYIIRGELVTACASAPATISEPDILVGSAEELGASALSMTQMVAVWNKLPGTKPVSKFTDRKTGAQRLWAAFAQLPVEPEPAAGPRAGSKQAQVIGLLRRPQGVTVDEVAAAMGWQRHTVRGLISGALKKKLGLEIISEQSERGRLYRIAEAGPVAP